MIQPFTPFLALSIILSPAHSPRHSASFSFLWTCQSCSHHLKSFAPVLLFALKVLLQDIAWLVFSSPSCIAFLSATLPKNHIDPDFPNPFSCFILLKTCNHNWTIVF